MKLHAGWLALALLAALPQRAAAYATFEIIVKDGPNEGFNDPTAATPVGGNTATTLGEQRLRALQYAADQWGALLDSEVVIRIEATFDPIECVGGYSTTLALGGTTYLEIVTDEHGDEVVVPTALGDRMEATDLEPGQPDISIQFNSNVDSGTCLDGTFWYYGLDGQPSGYDTDLIDTALHEIAHGLGIQPLHDPDTGELVDGTPSAFLKRLFDLDLGKHWDEMTNAERLTSQGNARRVVWDGPTTTEQSRALLAAGLPSVQSAQVPSLSGFYADASYGTWRVATTITGELAADTTGQCPPSNVNGKIALMPWDCAHSSWAASVEDEGAIGILVENPADWDVPAFPLDEAMPEPIGIPVIAISTSDLGRLIDGALAGTVTVEMSIDESEPLGADGEGRVMMNVTAPATSSSLAHLEPLARPNLLMEPVTAPRTLHDLDLTPAMLADIGWARFCGNGALNQAEECDDGEDNDDTKPDACRTDCKSAHCGDGVLDMGEACDEGAANSDERAGACRTTCKVASCGDGTIDDGEECDRGAANSDTDFNACRTSCKEPTCGDGVTDQGERCDEGAHNSDSEPDACRTTCQPARCGDAVIDDGEACDDGPDNDGATPGACSTFCARVSDQLDPDASSIDPEDDGGVMQHQDAGAPGPSHGDGGCGCRALGAERSSDAGALAWLAGLGGALLLRRRSRARG